MDKKHAIAGKYGDTILEHTLYKAYWRMILDKNDIKNTRQFLKEWSLAGTMEKIDCLRNSMQPWLKEDEEMINAGGRNSEIYVALIRKHSDLDIFKKARELNNKNFESYCQSKTHIFEKNYRKFIEECTALDKEFAEKKAKELKQKQQEEENRQKKKAQIERMKTLKPTVITVSNKKRK